MSPITSPKILIVEDEALLLFSIADDLRDVGFEVLEATNADAAIRLLATHPEIRLLFTDIDMPGSIDGLELSAIVIDRWPQIRIIVTSGKQRPAEDRMPRDCVFVPKPYVPNGVAEMIASILQ